MHTLKKGREEEDEGKSCSSGQVQLQQGCSPAGGRAGPQFPRQLAKPCCIWALHRASTATERRVPLSKHGLGCRCCGNHNLVF